MACDICGKTGCDLEQLKSEYQTDKISDLCSDCLRDVNKHLWEVRKMEMKMTMGLVKRFMTNLREYRNKEN